MSTLTNIPYVKRFNDKGELLNPIGTGYFSEFQNRRSRRGKEVRVFNNRKSCKLKVVGRWKYKIRVQSVFNKRKNRIVNIVHHILD